MTARQPRTPQEAAMLDPLGLMAFPAPNIPRGLFGTGRRRVSGYTIGRDGGGGASGSVSLSPPLDPASAPGMQPPSIDQAPPPPADWRQTLGPELVAQLPKVLAQNSGRTRVANGDTTLPLEISPMMPSLPMRGGPLGMSMPAGGLPMMSDKIANRGEPMPDANGKGKKGIDWRMIAGIAGDALLGLNGQAPLYAQNMWKLRQQQAEHQDRIAQMREQTRLKLSEPDYATVNNRRVRIDPMTGEAQVLYQAPQDFEDYAATLGAEPGSPEYDRLVQDYVLRSAGPTATDFNLQEEDNRQGNRISLEGVRQGNREALVDRRYSNSRALRAVPTYSQAHPKPRAAGGGSGGVREGQTATNPQTGAKVVYRGGKWVPAR